MLIALLSARGSPGTTTAGLAFTIAWGAPTILAECDPAGGTVMAGYLRGSLPAAYGLLPLALAELKRTGPVGPAIPDELFGQLVDLHAPHRERMLLPGVTDPAQSGTLMPLWGRFAQIFGALERIEPGYDVIADCGRIITPNAPWPLLWAADVVLLVVAPTLVSIDSALPVVPMINKQLIERTGTNTAFGLLISGSGPYKPEQIGRQLDVPVVATLPHDGPSAAVLCHGGDVRLGRPLLRSARAVRARIRAAGEDHRRHATGRPLRGMVPRA